LPCASHEHSCVLFIVLNDSGYAIDFHYLYQTTYRQDLRVTYLCNCLNDSQLQLQPRPVSSGVFSRVLRVASVIFRCSPLVPPFGLSFLPHYVGLLEGRVSLFVFRLLQLCSNMCFQIRKSSNLTDISVAAHPLLLDYSPPWRVAPTVKHSLLIGLVIAFLGLQLTFCLAPVGW